jgi:hypothetical protein
VSDVVKLADDPPGKVPMKHSAWYWLVLQLNDGPDVCEAPPSDQAPGPRSRTK